MAGVLGPYTKAQWIAMQNAQRRKAFNAKKAEPEETPPDDDGDDDGGGEDEVA